MKFILILFLIFINLYSKEEINNTQEEIKTKNTNKQIFLKPEYNLKFRTRYENINIDKNDPSSVLTNKTEFSFYSFFDFSPSLSIKLEANLINNLGIDNTYDVNSCPDCSKTKDLEDNRMTEYYLNYVLLENTFLRAGRQTINLGNQRFVSSNNWYQMKQTFDAFSIANNQIDNWVFIFSYLYQYNGIGINEESLNINDLFINVKYNSENLYNIDLYSYNIEDKHLTNGIRIYNKNNNNFKYNIEFANQISDNINSFYYNIGIGYNYNDITSYISYEMFGKNNENNDINGFTTPYTNTNIFNGKLNIFEDYIIKGHQGDFIDIKLTNKYKNEIYGNLNFDIHTFSLDGNDLGLEYDAYYNQKLEYDNDISIYLGYSIYQSQSDLFKNQNNFWIQLELKI